MKRVTPLHFLNFIAIIVIVALFAFTIYQDYCKQIQTAEKNTLFVAHLLAKHTESTIAELDSLLYSITIQLKQHDANPEQHRFENIVSFLKDIKHYNAQVMDLLVLDTDGQISGWTGIGAPPSVIDREYTQFHLESSDSDLYVGEPLLSKVHQGQWFFAVSKAVRQPDSKLQHIVVAIVDIEKFRAMISTIELPPFSSLALISTDGNIISRMPGHEQHVGKHIELNYDILEQVDNGNFAMRSRLDGAARIVGYRHLNAFNMTAFSTVSREEALRSWYNLVSLSLLLLLIILGLLHWFNLKIYREKIIIESQRLQLSKQARTDELTGLYNRRYIMQALHEAFKRARLQSSPLSLLMVDIDHFKSINDRFGHDAGDAVLKKVADTMTQNSRQDAIIGRIGGEEFLLLLPEATVEQAHHLAERIRLAVADISLVLEQDGVRCTVSIGIAECNFAEHPCMEDVAIKHADEAMYRAKHTGRNKVVTYVE